MARSLLVTALALMCAACVGPRVIGATPATPAWLESRVREAETTTRKPPDLSDVPTFAPETSSEAAWRSAVDDLANVRADLLADPALLNPDEGVDPEAFARQSRAQAERDRARQSGDDDDE